MKHFLKFTTICFLFLLANTCLAQHAHFVKKGVIEFEKRSNLYAMIRKKISSANAVYMQKTLEDYQKRNPQFKTDKSSLTFYNDRTLYKFSESQEPLSNDWINRNSLADLKNIVATDLNTQFSVTQKNVFGELYLVKDSVRKINWKITDETRTIAGFDCRRANALIMDSIYVVAYYSNEIAVSGGPESFTGLPGMILGLALPHENITWFATKITEVAVPEKSLLPPVKGKSVNNKGLADTLQLAFKNWGKYAQETLKAYLF